MAPMRAPYACDPAKSRGRHHPQPESAMRSAFQRDRDRIIIQALPPPEGKDPGLCGP